MFWTFLSECWQPSQLCFRFFLDRVELRFHICALWCAFSLEYLCDWYLILFQLHIMLSSVRRDVCKRVWRGGDGGWGGWVGGSWEVGDWRNATLTSCFNSWFSPRNHCYATSDQRYLILYEEMWLFVVVEVFVYWAGLYSRFRTCHHHVFVFHQFICLKLVCPQATNISLFWWSGCRLFNCID